MKAVELNGFSLTFSDVLNIAKNGAKVTISKEAQKRVKKARELIFKLADEGYPVYGLNRGVGWNKDKGVKEDFFQEYNENLIKIHCVSVEPYSSIEEVRAMMAIRLNTALCGSAGMAPEILSLYRDFLNHNIAPLVPSRGSIGEADIATLSHIGLALIGEGEVFYKGKRMSAKTALKKAGLKPAVLGPKDGLGIVSSNAHGAALATLGVKEVERLVSISNIIYCLGMEGLNGKVESFDKRVNELRKFKGQIKCASECRKFLKGSYLYEKDAERALQDSLAFRCGFTISGSVLDALNYVKNILKIQLNTSDDNPCILVEDEELLVSANFEPTSWVVGVEMLNIALNHLSKAACYRTMKLSNPTFTNLPRFLTPKEGESIGYGTIQKCFTALDTENRSLANPSSMDYFAVAGNIEDHANNTTLALQKMSKIIDNLYYILGIELMHATQAIDLRGVKKMGVVTKKAYKFTRERLPFLDKDRTLSFDIKKAYDIVKSDEFYKTIC